jgi:DegV family protein with EDD domain
VTVAVLTDTTSALPPGTARRWGIRLVPLTVTIGGQAHRDGDGAIEALLDGHAADVHTAGPRPGEFVRELAAAQDGQRPGAADAAVIVTVAENLSSTHASARLAAGQAGMPVEVVDSGTAAGAQALVALAAAEQARAGGGLAEVARAAREAAATVRLVGCLTSLDRLVASGRVPGIARVATRHLGLRPMFELRGGSVRPLTPARGGRGARERIAGMCARGQAGRDGPAVADVVVMDSGLPGEADALLARVEERVPAGLVLRASFGSAMTVHTGPGVLGLAWRWRLPCGLART